MTDASLAFTPEAVLFDCDGTLLLTADLHFEAMAEAVRRQGGRMPRDWYMALTGLGRRDTFARLAQEFDLRLDLPQVVSDSVALTADLAPRAVVNPEVAALARALAGRLPIAVVTNSEAVIAAGFLRATGMAGLFDAVLTVESAARPKPAPDLYLTAARRLDVCIDSCLVLEDSAQGIAAATGAGAVCLDVRDPGWSDRARPMLAGRVAGAGAAHPATPRSAADPQGANRDRRRPA